MFGDVEDPDTGGTLLEAWSGDMQMLGSGSDYAGEGRERDGERGSRAYDIERKRLLQQGRGGGIGVNLACALFSITRYSTFFLQSIWIYIYISFLYV